MRAWDGCKHNYWVGDACQGCAAAPESLWEFVGTFAVMLLLIVAVAALFLLGPA
jgi:hypothetical protein